MQPKPSTPAPKPEPRPREVDAALKAFGAHEPKRREWRAGEPF